MRVKENQQTSFTNDLKGYFLAYNAIYNKDIKMACKGKKKKGK